MGRTTQLRAALKKRFFQQVEAEGFIRDERNQPVFTCFRRKAGDVVQVFDVQWEKHGRPRFVINFTEAPISGFQYLGEHVAGDEAVAGHLTLPRGRLIPGRGIMSGSWFRLDRPLLSRLTSMRRDYDPDYVVGQVVALFPDVVAWWECKANGEHIRILPGESLYAKPKAYVDRVA